MERSAELEAVLRRFFAAMRANDVESVIAMWTQEEDSLLLGTDPDEWWSGRTVVEPVTRAQMAEMPFPFRANRVDCWSEGTVGWGCIDLTLEIDPPVSIRFTAVWHLELGAWKMVHAHTSMPARNIDTLGIELTTSIDALAQAVEVERPDLGSVTAPDGTVTLLFTDIEGSTERNQVLGDREWMQVLRGHHDLIREQVAANGGFEVKSMGDGFMLAFSSARKALRCAMDIQHAIAKDDDLNVRVRAGLHAGEAVRDGDDFYGATVNMAARVAGQAQGGEVLVSTLVKALVESSGEFTFDAPRSAELKGIAGEHALYPLAL